MNNIRITKSKLAQGLVSLITVIILLFSILATSILYENSITGNVISDVSSEDTSIEIQYIDDITDLNQLNEGWYEIRNGYVFYLEHFDSAVPLYIKIQNPRQQNGILSVDSDGNIKFRRR